MANVDATKLIQFYTGTKLPENPSSNHVYFVHNNGKGELYKGSVLIGETNDEASISEINSAIEKINADLAKKATKEELQQHVELYTALVGVVNGIDGRLTTAESQVAQNKTDIATNKADIATNLGKINGLVTRMGEAEDAIDAIEADYLKAADKTELSNAITAEANRATGVEADFETRISAVEADYLKAEDKTELSNAITAEQSRAEGAESALSARIKTVEDDYLKAADKTELQGSINTLSQTHTSDKNELAASIKAISDDYLKAADKTALQSQITENTNAITLLTEGVDAEKIDGVKDLIDYVDTHGPEVTGMKADIATNATDIVNIKEDIVEINDALDTKVEAEAYNVKMASLDDVDEDHTTRIQALEAKFTGGEGSVASQIETAINAEKAAREAAIAEVQKDADQGIADAENALKAAQAADGKAVAAQGAVDALELVVAEKAAQADLTALAGRVTTAEGNITSLDGRVDAIEEDLNADNTGLKARMSAAEGNISTNAANIGINTVDIASLYNALQWQQII